MVKCYVYLQTNCAKLLFFFLESHFVFNKSTIFDIFGPLKKIPQVCVRKVVGNFFVRATQKKYISTKYSVPH